MACEQAESATDALELALSGPAKTAVDGAVVEQHKLTDLVAADRYMASRCATTKARRGLRFTKLIPPGTD